MVMLVTEVTAIQMPGTYGASVHHNRSPRTMYIKAATTMAVRTPEMTDESFIDQDFSRQPVRKP